MRTCGGAAGGGAARLLTTRLVAVAALGAAPFSAAALGGAPFSAAALGAAALSTSTLGAAPLAAALFEATTVPAAAALGAAAALAAEDSLPAALLGAALGVPFVDGTTVPFGTLVDAAPLAPPSSNAALPAAMLLAAMPPDALPAAKAALLELKRGGSVPASCLARKGALHTLLRQWRQVMRGFPFALLVTGGPEGAGAAAGGAGAAAAAARQSAGGERAARMPSRARAPEGAVAQPRANRAMPPQSIISAGSPRHSASRTCPPSRSLSLGNRRMWSSSSPCWS